MRTELTFAEFENMDENLFRYLLDSKEDKAKAYIGIYRDASHYSLYINTEEDHLVISLYHGANEKVFDKKYLLEKSAYMYLPDIIRDVTLHTTSRYSVLGFEIKSLSAYPPKYYVFKRVATLAEALQAANEANKAGLGTNPDYIYVAYTD